jgi:hypothetical protein
VYVLTFCNLVLDLILEFFEKVLKDLSIKVCEFHCFSCTISFVCDKVSVYFFSVVWVS